MKKTESGSRKNVYADAILNSLGSHVAILDSNGVITAVNDSWKTFAEQNEGRLAAVSEGVNYLDVCRKASAEGDEDAEKALTGVQDVLDGKKNIFEMEYPCHSPDEERWFFLRVTPLIDDSGKILITHLNISGRVLASRNLQRMNETLRHITSSISGIVFQFLRRADGSYSVPYVSDQVTGLSGFSPEEIMRDADLLLKPIHPDDQERALAEIERSYRNLSRYSLEHRLVTPNGELRWFRVESTPKRLENGDTLWNGVSIDITDRKHSEEALKKSERRLKNLMERYRAVFANTGAATFIADSDTLIEQINDEGERILQCDKTQLEGKRKWLDFITESNLRAMRLNHDKLLEEGASSPLHLETTIRTCADEIRNIHLTVTRLPETTKFIASFVDITDRIKAESELMMKTVELERQSERLKEVNSALKVVLKQREVDKKELEENVARNITELVCPYIESLKESLRNSDLEQIVSIIESNIHDIASPFLSRMTMSFFNLSPMEIKVAHLIKDGRGNKEIAGICSVSESTIKTHRAKIRDKLGLRNKKVNLQSYLGKFA